jgi:2-oxoisovalerate dehydrogenase E2 component (dihydrolipoyl transacylase)
LSTTIIGVVVTTPVINYPEVAIIGVNRMVERPVARGGQDCLRISPAPRHLVFRAHESNQLVAADI